MKVGAIGKSKPVSGNSEPPPPAEQEHAEAEEHDQERRPGFLVVEEAEQDEEQHETVQPIYQAWGAATDIKPGAQLPTQNASNSRSSIGQRWPGQHGASLKKEISSSGLMRRAKSYCWSHDVSSGSPAMDSIFMWITARVARCRSKSPAAS